MSYNGYKNYETWNIALWLSNDYTLYKLAVSHSRAGYDYKSFASEILHGSTPDGVSYFDDRLDIEHLDQVMKDFSEE
jgi:hypothetical protein